MKIDRLLKISLWAFLIGLGVVIGIAIRHYANIPLAETINIIDVATLVTTIFLAVYIPEVLNRRLEVKKDKQDMIIKRIEELQVLYRRSNMIIQSEYISVNETSIVMNLVDICQHKIDTVVSLLNAAGMAQDFTDDIKQIEEIVDEYTNHIRNNPGNFDLAIKMREEALYVELDQKTSMLILKIYDDNN